MGFSTSSGLDSFVFEIPLRSTLGPSVSVDYLLVGELYCFDIIITSLLLLTLANLFVNSSLPQFQLSSAFTEELRFSSVRVKVTSIARAGVSPSRTEKSEKFSGSNVKYIWD